MKLKKHPDIKLKNKRISINKVKQRGGERDENKRQTQKETEMELETRRNLSLRTQSSKTEENGGKMKDKRRKNARHE